MSTRRALLVLVAVLASGCAAQTDGTRAGGRDAGGRDVRPRATTSPSVSPLPTDTFRFAAIGDFGAGSEPQYDVAARMCRYRETRPFEVVITTGDNIYPDGDPALFDANFFRPYDCLLDAGVRFHASLGNHDVLTDGGQPEMDEPAFGMRGRNYVVLRGGVRFVIVDSNDLDVPWISGATRPSEGDRWTVVAFHHPVYSPGDAHGSTPGFRDRLHELFARRGVDLVLNGHDHIYSVTKALRGIRYVVTGGGGSERLDACNDEWFTRRCVSRHHFVSVVAGPDDIVVEAVPISGRPFDRFVTRGVD